MKAIKLRIYDKNNLIAKMSYGKAEWFDDMLGFRFDHFDSEPEDMVLMQYTGLKDKNDNEVYEGDVLSYKAVIYTDCSKTEVERIYDEALIGIINHSSIATVVRPYTKNVPAFGHDIENNTKLILDLDSKTIEIIGNIYENPELLEVEG